jgi:HEAT repeat protein
MAGELERLCRMLEDGDAELRIAVARVLRELKPKDAAVKKALLGALKSENDMLRLYAVEALAATDLEAAVPHLVPHLAGPENLRARVTQLLLGAGAAAAEALRDRLDEKDPKVRQGVLEVLSKLPGVDPVDSLFEGLLDADVEVARRAAGALRQRTEGLQGAEKAKSLKRVAEFLDSSKVKKSKTALAPVLQVVGAYKDPAAAKILLSHVDRKQAPEARTAALLGLAGIPLEGKEASQAAAKLLPLLDEADFNATVKPALDLLWKLPVGKEHADRVLKLLKSPTGPVRHFALKALGGVGSAAAGAALIEALLGTDPRLAETADVSLRSNPDYVPQLVKALDGADLEKQEEVVKAFKAVHILKAFKNVLDKSLVKKFMARTLQMLDKKQSGFQAYFEIVRAAAPALAKDEALDRGRELLKKGKHEEAERVLRLLQRDDLASPEGDLALGIAQLRQQRLDPAGAGRDQGNAIQLFQKLSRKENYSLLKALEKEAGLVTAEGLLYLGFALVERQGAERDLGGAVLKLVARKFAAKEEGKIAKQKIKTQGIG